MGVCARGFHIATQPVNVHEHVIVSPEYEFPVSFLDGAIRRIRFAWPRFPESPDWQMLGMPPDDGVGVIIAVVIDDDYLPVHVIADSKMTELGERLVE
jgi:hypothetical protein